MLCFPHYHISLDRQVIKLCLTSKGTGEREIGSTGQMTMITKYPYMCMYEQESVIGRKLVELKWNSIYTGGKLQKNSMACRDYVFWNAFRFTEKL